MVGGMVGAESNAGTRSDSVGGFRSQRKWRDARQGRLCLSVCQGSVGEGGGMTETSLRGVVKQVLVRENN